MPIRVHFSSDLSYSENETSFFTAIKNCIYDNYKAQEKKELADIRKRSFSSAGKCTDRLRSREDCWRRPEEIKKIMVLCKLGIAFKCKIKDRFMEQKP
jgi:hypothetical protein